MSTKNHKNKMTRAEKWNEMYIKAAGAGSDDAWSCIEALARDAVVRIASRADLLVFEDGSAALMDHRLLEPGLDGSLLPALGFVTLRNCGHLLPKQGTKIDLFSLLEREKKTGEFVDKSAAHHKVAYDRRASTPAQALAERILVHLTENEGYDSTAERLFEEANAVGWATVPLVAIREALALLRRSRLVGLGDKYGGQHSHELTAEGRAEAERLWLRKQAAR